MPFIHKILKYFLPKLPYTKIKCFAYNYGNHSFIQVMHWSSLPAYTHWIICVFSWYNLFNHFMQIFCQTTLMRARTIIILVQRFYWNPSVSMKNWKKKNILNSCERTKSHIICILFCSLSRTQYATYMQRYTCIVRVK